MSTSSSDTKQLLAQTNLIHFLLELGLLKTPKETRKRKAQSTESPPLLTPLAKRTKRSKLI